MDTIIINSPVGNLRLTANDLALTGLDFTDEQITGGTTNPVLTETVRQLEEYFNGTRRTFEIPLETTGTDFTRRVWDELKNIPYGEAISYKQLASNSGSPKAFRAVGMCNGKNKIAIIIPCHRVINADRGLGGFSGGLDKKRFLLRHEGIAFKE
ncbi:MAG TPA: methylated-DNA--[protein]-cysteine S-methyltransferase [Clostridiaceae bacterium]|nr:methylated-DNA--[protein]-cysteine S-methyltransferase [Clostridiaceae bacterium]